LYTRQLKALIAKLLHSRRGLAIPVTYLILFASLIALISVTYSFAITKISSRSADIKASIAKQNMQILDNSINSVLWSSGASSIVYMDDAGGTFQITPTARRLILNCTDGHAFNKVIFNGTVGEAFYQLLPSESNENGFYIRGDGRAIINQSAYTLTQLYFADVDYSKSLILSYRPSVTAIAVDANSNMSLNLIRINIVSLDSSQPMLTDGKFYLRETSANVTSEIFHYVLNQSIPSIALISTLSGVETTVWLPISSNSTMATLNFEIVTCNVRIQEVEG
jgi:hypothetical protein